MKMFTNKKGFTIVELVIVIAVIAILAAVLIPTFSGVIDKANQSAATQEARTALTAVSGQLAEKNLTPEAGKLFFVVHHGSKYYSFTYSDSGLSDPQITADKNDKGEDANPAGTMTYTHSLATAQVKDIPSEVTVYANYDISAAGGVAK